MGNVKSRLPIRDKNGKFVKGGGSYWTGKKLPPETIQKSSESHKQYYKNGGKSYGSFTKGMTPHNKGKAHLADEKHPLWKGDSVSYSPLHSWVSRKLGKPKECSDCGFASDNGRQFHWANISGQYLRDLEDWERLCARCHFKKDKIAIRGWVTRKAKYGISGKN